MWHKQGGCVLRFCFLCLDGERKKFSGLAPSLFFHVHFASTTEWDFSVCLQETWRSAWSSHYHKAISLRCPRRCAGWFWSSPQPANRRPWRPSGLPCNAPSQPSWKLLPNTPSTTPWPSWCRNARLVFWFHLFVSILCAVPWRILYLCEYGSCEKSWQMNGSSALWLSVGFGWIVAVNTSRLNVRFQYFWRINSSFFAHIFIHLR